MKDLLENLRAVGLTVRVIDEDTKFPSAGKWFVTFGFNTPYSKQYYKLEAEGYAAARAEAFKKFGRAWAFMYPIEELEQQIKDYNLTERK